MNNKLFKPSDLYWMCKWLISKIYYSALPIPALMRLAKLKGLFKSFASKKRFVVKENIVSVFGDSKSEREIQALARRHFEYLEKVHTAFFLLRLRQNINPRNWPIEGLDHLDSALAQGKGVILVSAHFGYSRAIKPLLKMRGYSVSLVGNKAGAKIGKEYKSRLKKQLGRSRFGRFIFKRLELANLTQEDNDFPAELNVRPLVKALKRNEIIVIMGDGLHAMNFVEFKILDQLLPFPTGWMSIAAETGAAVLPVFVVDSTDKLGLQLFIEKPLTISKNERIKPDLAAGVECFARLFGSYVERYPHLYKWGKTSRSQKWLTRSKLDLAERY
jgi:KDO2-lipid IV(A) lauroyltransferase